MKYIIVFASFYSFVDLVARWEKQNHGALCKAISAKLLIEKQNHGSLMALVSMIFNVILIEINHILIKVLIVVKLTFIFRYCLVKPNNIGNNQ
jgi:hypothetical protein